MATSVATTLGRPVRGRLSMRKRLFSSFIALAMFVVTAATVLADSTGPHV